MKWLRTGSTSAAPPATSRSTFPRQRRPKDLSILQCDIHLIEIKYGEDTRPQSQLSAAQEQQKGLRSILQGASVTLHTMLLGVGGTIYNNDTLEAFKELGLDCQRVEQLACFRVLLTLCHLRCQTCSNQTCPFRYQYKLSLRAGEIRTSLQPSYSPLVSSSFVSCWRSCMVPGTKAGPFSLNNVEGDFYVCLHSFFFSIERDQPKPATFRKVTLLKHSFKKVSVSHAQLAHLSTLAKEKHMLLILNFSTLTFITNARTTMPFAGLHFQNGVHAI